MKKYFNDDQIVSTNYGKIEEMNILSYYLCRDDKNIFRLTCVWLTDDKNYLTDTCDFSILPKENETLYIERNWNMHYDEEGNKCTVPTPYFNKFIDQIVQYFIGKKIITEEHYNK